MKLPDVNIWIALAISSHKHHEAACRWLEKQDALDSIGFCRFTQQAYLRLLSQAALIRRYELPPLTNAEVWNAYERLSYDDRIVFLLEPAGLEPIWKDFGKRDTASSKVWIDAYLAAFAMAGRHQVVTFDRGFEQFPRLELVLLEN